MVAFWDYLFYRIYWFHDRVLRNHNDDMFFAAVIGVSFFMMANYYFVLELISFGMYDVRLGGKIIYLGPLTLIIIANYLFYNRKARYKTVIKRGNEINKETKVYRDILCVSYIVISFVSMGFMIYLKRNNIDIF